MFSSQCTSSSSSSSFSRFLSLFSGFAAMALAMGPAKLATTSHSRLQMSCSPHSVARIATLPASDFFASQLCLFVKDARMVVTDGRKLVAVPRAAAAATMAQSRTRISDTFVKLKQQGKVALIPYLTAGDPSLDTTAEAMRVLDACGADIIEVGVPYTDPLADGPVIQAAATRSLAQGTTLDKVLAMVREVTPTLGAPVVLFTYYNPILKRGPETFLKAVKEAGASGLVVPDLPLEETGKLRELSTANGLELILLTTPTTPQDRMEVIARASQGFVYLVGSSEASVFFPSIFECTAMVSLTGVTGARLSVQSRVEKLLKELKQVTDMPIAVGFGISKPEHATLVARWGADGVIVGSAMVKILGEAANPKDGLAALEQFTRDLKASLS